MELTYRITRALVSPGGILLLVAVAAGTYYLS